MSALRPRILLAALAFVLVALALARPLDHDESQYVAAVALTAHGLLPYRDFAYLQTPLQPFLFSPLALFGESTWPALRIANALLGACAVAFAYAAMREAGVRMGTALACAALFACCDILLFSVGTARNDALPVACLAGALWMIVRAGKRGATPAAAALAGALLAAAAAAKISYALPAAAYGLYALTHRRHLPLWVAAGAAPVAVFVAWSFAQSPQGFVFGIFEFPARAPGEYYLAQGRLWKLSLAAKAVDTLKFLALGPALLALLLVARDRLRTRQPEAIDWMIAAGLIAALLPEPTWRQYLLPLLPALFVGLAILWEAHPPARAVRILCVIFACAGLAPSVEALARGGGLNEAMRQSRAIGTALDAVHYSGPIATLSPQFLPAARRLPDPRFATGPFYFRSTGLLAAPAEAQLRLISRARLPDMPGILVGGEGAWTSGDSALDTALENWAIAHHRWRIHVPGSRFRLYLKQP